jgi:hypothetical protein
MEKFIDWEAQKLIRLIENKRAYYMKLDPATMQAKHLLSEIEFLEQDILPIIVYKNPYISDINKYMDSKIIEIAKMPISKRLVGIMTYYHLKDPSNDKIEPVAFISTNNNLLAPADLTMEIKQTATESRFLTIVPLEL